MRRRSGKARSPTRFKCELLVQVSEHDGIHLREVQNQSPQPDTCNWIFRGSPQEMPRDDSEWILARLEEISKTAPTVPPVEIEVGGDEAEGEESVHPDEVMEEAGADEGAPPERAHGGCETRPRVAQGAPVELPRRLRRGGLWLAPSRSGRRA
jgi:hypothetical protein